MISSTYFDFIMCNLHHVCDIELSIFCTASFPHHLVVDVPGGRHQGNITSLLREHKRRISYLTTG